MKTCKRCGENKDLKEFYKNARMEDGRTILCRDCLYKPKIGRHSDVKDRRERKRKLRAEQMKKYGLEVREVVSEEERFWKLVDKSGDCWLWTGYHNKAGRAIFRLSGTGMMIYASRWVWAKVHGPIPKGLCILHTCDNGLCVNPDHLFSGTQEDNVQDMIKKGRAVWQKKSKDS